MRCLPRSTSKRLAAARVALRTIGALFKVRIELRNDFIGNKFTVLDGGYEGFYCSKILIHLLNVTVLLYLRQ